ncbi:MAG TPA: Crp/Fnr family transcriptional regulator [Terriglobia bacterium]|nr:Crp/Fnr family transcriptional regulator [Terriglobia bacterium]
MDKEQSLSRVPLFIGLPSSEMKALGGRAVRKKFSKGEMLFTEGEPAHGLYIVESGSIKIFKVASSGREQVLHVEAAGNSVAEIPLFDGGPYPASGAALEDSTLLFIDRKSFESLCLSRPQIALSVIRVIGGRLRKLTRLLEEISLKDVAHRLAWWLLEKVKDTPRADPDSVEFQLELSHEDIGTRIGTVREVVTRAFSRLESEGLVRVSGRTLKILSIRKLKTLLEE